MSAKTPTQTATALVRNILSNHPPLSTSQIFKIGTDGLRPALTPAVAFKTDGSIKMKRASNMREGSRMWIPPQQVPFPLHPFQSMTYLKGKILANLEMQNLIQKVIFSRPLETDEERQEAIRVAARSTRRQDARALKEGITPNPAVEPATEIQEYRWVLAPTPHTPRPTTISSPGASGSRSPSPPVTITKEQQYRWTKAEDLEARAVRLRNLEQEHISERKAKRAEYWRQTKQLLNAQKAELKASGKWDLMAQNRKINNAKAEILRYAEQTGEDVSSWLAELEVDLPISDDEAKEMRERYLKGKEGGKERKTKIREAWGSTSLVGRVSPERRRQAELLQMRSSPKKPKQPKLWQRSQH